MIEEEKSDYPPLIIKEAYSDEYRVVSTDVEASIMMKRRFICRQ